MEKEEVEPENSRSPPNKLKKCRERFAHLFFLYLGKLSEDKSHSHKGPVKNEIWALAGVAQWIHC